MANGSYHSRTMPTGEFRGARVDLAAKVVYLHNAAVCNPSPATIPTNVAWQGDFPHLTQAGKFYVYTADLALYGPFDLPQANVAAVEYAAPFIWAGATTVVLGVTWVLRAAIQKGIGDIVDKKLEPINKKLKRLERQDRFRVVDPDEKTGEQ